MFDSRLPFFLPFHFHHPHHGNHLFRPSKSLSLSHSHAYRLTHSSSLPPSLQPAASQAPAATSLPAFGQPSAAQPNSGGSSGGTNFQLTPTNTNNVVFSGFGMTSQSQPQQQNHQQQQQQPAAASTPFSFAQPGQQQQQPATSSAAPASGSLFGPAPATGGLFAPKPAVTSAPAAGGLFGAAPAAPAATSLFGAAPAAGTTGLFGAAPATASSLFGAAPATQPQQQSSFGQSQPFSVSQLGASQPAPQQQAQQQQQAGQQQQQQLDRRLGPSLSAKMIAIHQAWDTNNLQTCRFLVSSFQSSSALLILTNTLFAASSTTSTALCHRKCGHSWVQRAQAAEAERLSTPTWAGVPMPLGKGTMPCGHKLQERTQSQVGEYPLLRSRSLTSTANATYTPPQLGPSASRGLPRSQSALRVTSCRSRTTASAPSGHPNSSNNARASALIAQRHARSRSSASSSSAGPPPPRQCAPGALAHSRPQGKQRERRGRGTARKVGEV